MIEFREGSKMSKVEIKMAIQKKVDRVRRLQALRANARDQERRDHLSDVIGQLFVEIDVLESEIE